MNEIRAWYGFTFRLGPGEQARPWLDFFLLDQVVREIVEEHSTHLPCWKIHRRWRNDADGHEFKFDIWSTADGQSLVTESLRKSSAWRLLSRFGLVADAVIIPSPPVLSFAEASGDWPLQIRESWPIFMHGASQMLLAFVKSVCAHPDIAALPSPTSSPAALEQFYSKVEEIVIAMWRGSGGHAFLHHLNMLFGYEPLACVPTMHGLMLSF